MSDTRRRVKLYALNADRQWDDKGTGHVSAAYVERLKGVSLLVRAEADGSLLLESRIQIDTAYQKQQETLIVWSEGDNFDLALSFQEKGGCDEIWEKICSVQGKDPSVDFTQDIVEESEDERCFDEMMSSGEPVQPIELPPCEIGRLEEISELVNSCLPSPNRREKLAVAIENEGYIKKLLNVFHMCEDLDNMDGLHHLYEIFKNIFLLNKNALFELMFAEDTIFDVIGCLEFDPNLPAPKRHRQYLKSIAKFHQVININNPELLSKIHQTYRVQYIQDVVLPTPSVFEENMLSTLSSFIFFNKVEIVSLIQEDEKFLNDLFNQLTDGKTEENTRKESVLFLKEFCTFSQTLQPQSRESFFKTLSNLGILPALEITLASENKVTKAASIDILLFIVEFSSSMVREYMLQQLANSSESDSLLMNVMIEQMTSDSDPDMGGAVQLMGIIRTLLDPENMLATVNKSEKTDFLNYFYKHCMHVLITPLLSSTAGDSPEKMNACRVQLLSLILDLLSFCVEHHTYHIKNYILQKDLLRRILVLMSSKHTFLVLCALRFMRKIIALKDEFYNRYIIKGNLFAPVVKAFISNNGRYNLLDSAVLEMFEFIKGDDGKSLCSHVMESFGPTLDKVSYVPTFKALKLRYDQHQDRLRDRSQAQLESVGSILRPGRFRRDPRDLDEDEEMWFNDDEYDDQPGGASESTSSGVSNSLASSVGSMGGAQIPLSATHQGQNASSPNELNGEGSGSPTAVETPQAIDEESCSVGDHEQASVATPKELLPHDLAKTLPNGINAGMANKSETILQSSNGAAASAATKKGLVDYEEDSDDDDDENSSPRSDNVASKTEAASLTKDPETPEDVSATSSVMTDDRSKISRPTIDDPTTPSLEPAPSSSSIVSPTSMSTPSVSSESSALPIPASTDSEESSVSDRATKTTPLAASPEMAKKESDDANPVELTGGSKDSHQVLPVSEVVEMSEPLSAEAGFAAASDESGLEPAAKRARTDL